MPREESGMARQDDGSVYLRRREHGLEEADVEVAGP